MASYWGAYSHGCAVKDAEWQTRWAVRDAADKQAWAVEEAAAREEEKRRAKAQEEVRADAHEQRTIADIAAAGADAAGQRLRDEAGNLAASVSCAGPDPAAAARGEAARRAAMVLSDLLARSVDTNRELAAAYDSARVAGLACEASYLILVNPGGEHGRSAGENGGR
ncbi:DUF2514 domain-containing protein [Pseudomonas xanthosomatis]|uniref:DUF2514 domain-containing protein n=1 Tax=Pseudomonas xanthosomatis TaxID=2842356 RepID=UPI0035177341